MSDGASQGAGAAVRTEGHGPRAASGVLDRFRLDGRVALVTGGYRGLGRAFAQALAEAGADVAVSARDEAACVEAAAEIAASTGRRTLGLRMDVTDRAEVQAGVERVVAELGGLQVLVNNAGTCIHEPALEVSDAHFQEVLQTNVTGVWLPSQVAAPFLAQQGPDGVRGTVVNIGSISAHIVNRPQMQPVYNASKAAVHQLTKSLAAEWAPMGIRVNALAPGFFTSEMTDTYPEGYLETALARVPAGRKGDPRELAATALWLASDAAGYVTGQTIPVDGGLTIA